MISLMSHELRTPITSIKGFAEILLLDDTHIAETREYFDNNRQRISTPFQNAYDISFGFKSRTIRQTGMKKSPVKLDTDGQSDRRRFSETAKRKRIRLVEQTNTPIPPIAADKGLITPRNFAPD